MIVQKELANNPFGHGDFARTTLPGSIASWHKATFYKLLRRSENVILKTMYVLTNPFWFKSHAK